MRFLTFLMLLVFTFSLVSADLEVKLEVDKKFYKAGENIEVKVKLNTKEENVWDTYLYFSDIRHTPLYITLDGNTLEPKTLGMLPKVFNLKAKNWRMDDKVRLFVRICEYGTQKVIAGAHVSFVIEQDFFEADKLRLPVGPQIKLVQEKSEETSRYYTNYKQFDSAWKYDKMGQYDGTTIGKSGCAMTSAGNVIGWNPRNLNNRLKSNGGYQGNLIIWTKVPGVSYAGSGSISDSLFNRYHVIGYVGGHFVLLTGIKSSGQYYSHDPGKSSNPVYSSRQIYSVRLYNK